MSRRYGAMVSVLTTCVLLAAAVAASAGRPDGVPGATPGNGAQQPHIVNAQLAPRPAGASLPQTFHALVASQTEPAWVGYAVPARDRNRSSCCWSNADGTTHFSGTMRSGSMPCCGACRLEPRATGTAAAPAAAPAQGPIKLEGSGRFVVLFRIVDKQVEGVRSYSEDCQLDAGGRQVYWLEDVRPADSVRLLRSLIEATPERKNRVTNTALLAISQHAEPSAGDVITELARAHASPSVRGEALFWLAQMAGEKVAGTITAAIANDPDTDVKKRAVFALSQLPKAEGVPLLIDVARKNANPAVRKQAMFWLGQSKDPRAIDFFAEILR